MKRITLFFCSCLFMLHAEAQTAAINKIRKSLLSASDTTRVLLLEKLSSELKGSRPDTALLLAEEGLALAEDIDYKKGEAVCLNRMGTILRSTGNYPLAFKKLIEALKINEEIHNEDGRMRNLGNIGNIYADQHDYYEALNYSFQEKRIAEKVKDEDKLLLTILGIGDTYEKVGKLDSARIITNQAYEFAKKLDDMASIGTAFNNLGNIYSKMNEPDTALKYYKQSLVYYGEDEGEGICESSLGMAKIFQDKGKYDSALFYAKRAVAVAQNNFPKYLLDASIFLTGYYKNRGNSDSALFYQGSIITANDSLFNQEKTRQIYNMTFNEKNRQQQLEMERKRKEEERRDNIQLMGIATVIISVLLAFLLLRKKKTNAKTVEVLGVIGLLMLFEFVSLILHPYIEEITHHAPVMMMLLLVGIAAVLVPFHHYLEKLVKKKLAHKIKATQSF